MTDTKPEYNAGNWRKFTDFASYAINLMPFIIYLSLIIQQQDLASGILPFALYYAFRRSGLLLLRDFQKNYSLLGWIGLVSALIGYGLGLLGYFGSWYYDLAAVGIGLGSALFPVAVNQNKRLAENKSSIVGQVISLLILLALAAGIYWLKRAWLGYAVMFVIVIVAILGYSPVQTASSKINWHWYNYVLGILLFCSMGLVRWGRSNSLNQPIEWGMLFLGSFFVIMLILLFLDRQRPKTPGLRLAAMVAGAGGQYWTLYSTIYVGANYGLKKYYLVLVAYLLAMLFGGAVLSWLEKVSGFTTVTICMLSMILGLAATFWFPIYVLGIFLLRAGAAKLRQQAVMVYEAGGGDKAISYLVNYNYAAASSLFTQFVFWLSLLVLAKPAGLNLILKSFATNTFYPDMAEFINASHLVLGGYLFVVFLVCWIKLAKENEKNI
ncbi:hypothetical protein [Lactobacillus corticis]|uniref:Membrane protein n=1 Tax=Lactobacillus corticis TaxID=2201249 RepID=A0A916QG07_9LACO|nr:hypothetical protein [Lactobacillus corticis]GFZ26319.1 membrane protein [Lactobacillus corticis]